MAKISYVRSRSRKQGGKGFRRIHAAIDVSLDNRPGGAVFVACVSAGRQPEKRMQPGAFRRHVKRAVTACVSASNPRQAIASAMKRAGEQIATRGGAFAGWRK